MHEQAYGVNHEADKDEECDDPRDDLQRRERCLEAMQVDLALFDEH